MNTTQPKLTVERAFEIQEEQLEHWEAVLKPHVYRDLCVHCLMKNQEVVKSEQPDGMYVFRGSDMDNFVANYKPKK